MEFMMYNKKIIPGTAVQLSFIIFDVDPLHKEQTESSFNQ